MTSPVQTTTDEPTALRQRLAEGEAGAFEDLVRQYQDRIINLAYHLLADREAARDIAQDVFVRAFHGLKKFRGEAELFTWLYRITVNLSLNYRRKRKWERLFSFTEPADTDRWQTDESSRPDAMAERKEVHHLLQKALARLPEKQRALVLLQRWEGLSYKQIAEVTGLSLSAVESKLHRANKKLAVMLPELLERGDSCNNVKSKSSPQEESFSA